MALSGTVDWDCRSGGAANYGGGFNRSASGTDRSQSTTPWVEVEQSAVVCTVQTTTTLLRFTLGYTVATTDVGNLFYVTGGSGATVGWYEITGVDTVNNDWVLDRAIGASTTAPTGNMGGALSHPGDIIQSTSPLLAGHRVYSKGAMTFTTSNDLNLPAIANVLVQGYTTTRGDGVLPTWTVSGSGVTLITLASSSATGWEFNYIDFYGASQTSSRGYNGSSGSISFVGCKFRAFTLNCVTTTVVNRFIGCEFTDCTTSTTFVGNTGNSVISGCLFRDNAATNFSLANGGRAVVSQTLFCDPSNAAGATADHLQISSSNAIMDVIGCTIDSAGRHGINYQSNAAPSIVANCLFTNNGGYGISTTATNPPMIVTNCADDGSNTSGAYTGINTARVSGWVTLTGDPYNNKGSGDFRLDNITGEGASCRNGGYPTSLNSFSDYNAIGAFGTPNSGGGGVRSFAWSG